jgi:hypothetical protein
MPAPYTHRRPAAEIVMTGGELVRGESGRGLYTLASPVTLVTSTLGGETFTDSRALFERLEQLAETGIEIQQLNNRIEAVSTDGIAALNLMLQTCGLVRFRTAAKRQTTPARAHNTRFQWAFMAEYLGWDWKAL